MRDRKPSTARVDDAEQRMIRRARGRAAALAAGLVALTFALCAGLTLAVVITAQNHDDTTLLQQSVRVADDVDDPPAGVWLTIRTSTSTRSSPGLPAGLPVQAALDRLADAPVGAKDTREVRVISGEYRSFTAVRTSRAGAREVVQAVLSLRVEHAERRHLITALLGAAGLALVLAALTGALLGHRTVRGLAGALSRQRRFVADASHELRTPLAVLSTRVQLFARTARDEQSRHELDALRRDVDRMGEVLDDLLSAAEPADVGGECDLASVVVDVVAGARAAAAEAGLHVDAEVAEAALPVRAPAATVRRALVALLDNAIRHTPPGGAVTVGAARADLARRPAVALTVSDTGPGIDPAVQATLFARRGRGGDETGTRRRYGLGLALLAESVQRVGGTVAVSSSPAGTTFTVTIPSSTESASTAAR